MTVLRNVEADLSRFRVRVVAASLLVVFCFSLVAARLVYLQGSDTRIYWNRQRATAPP